MLLLQLLLVALALHEPLKLARLTMEVVEVELRDTTIDFMTSFYRKVDHLGEKEASGKVYTGKADGGDASKSIEL